MTDTKEMLGWDEENLSWRWVGDLALGVASIELSCKLEAVEYSATSHEVRVIDSEGDILAWGYGDTRDEALRYAIGAAWGDGGDHDDFAMREVLALVAV